VHYTQVHGPDRIHPSEHTVTHIFIYKYGIVGGHPQLLRLGLGPGPGGGPHTPFVTTFGRLQTHYVYPLLVTNPFVQGVHYEEFYEALIDPAGHNKHYPPLIKLPAGQLQLAPF